MQTMTFNNPYLEMAFKRSLLNNQGNPGFENSAFSGIGQTPPTQPTVAAAPLEQGFSKIYIEHVPFFINTSQTQQKSSPSLGRLVLFLVLMFLTIKGYLYINRPQKPKRDVSYYLRMAQMGY
jgi:hypothetical protein